MDKETLKQYVMLKKEVAMLERKIEDLRVRAENVPTVIGKVSASSKEFPYTLQHVSVEMDEPEAAARIKALIWLKEKRKEKSERLLIDIEKFIADIPEPDLRLMFELSYQDGLKQEEVAEYVCLDRSRVSRKIDDYIKRTQSTEKV